jgi:flagellar L-ring protein precursor FlgH
MKNWVLVIALIAIAGTAGADSLFTKARADQGGMITDRNPQLKPGDIITVKVEEDIEAETTADTNTRKQAEVSSEADAGDNTFLIAPEPDGHGITTAEKLPNWGIEADNETKTRGSTKRDNELTLTVACVVVEVMKNGNLVIEGSKNVAVNREVSRIYVKGVVRSRDISYDNTVSSLKLANATVELKGQGPLWNNQRRGFFTRLLDWVAPY